VGAKKGGGGEEPLPLRREWLLGRGMVEKKQTASGDLLIWLMINLLKRESGGGVKPDPESDVNVGKGWGGRGVVVNFLFAGWEG